MILQWVALQAGTKQNAPTGAAGALQLVAIALVIGGFCFYAKMKGRSGVLGLLGLLSCLGLIILHFLTKKCQNCFSSAGHAAKECSTCGGPV